MQHVVNKLRLMIKNHYGLDSELELRSTYSHQAINREFYNPADKCLSVPIYDPNNEHIIAFFKVNNISADLSESFEKINDLVSMTLQTYLNLLNKHEITKNLVGHLQTEINPQKVIPLHKQRRLKNNFATNDLMVNKAKHKLVHEPGITNHELLIFNNQSMNLLKLVMQIHASSKNSFFLHLSHMANDFMSTINDLANLENTTLFIEDLNKLSLVQKKTLETHFLVRKSTSLLIVAGTTLPIRDLQEDLICEHLIKHFHYFHILSHKETQLTAKNVELEHYAQAMLGMVTTNLINYNSNSLKVKSHNLIPCLKELYPTIH